MRTDTATGIVATAPAHEPGTAVAALTGPDREHVTPPAVIDTDLTLLIPHRAQGGFRVELRRKSHGGRQDRDRDRVPRPERFGASPRPGRA